MDNEALITKPNRRGGPGRRTRLTPEVQMVILAAVKAGNHLAAAADYAGISRHTLYEWLARGEGDHSARPATPQLRNFAAAVRKADAFARMAALRRITAVAKGGVIKETRTDTGSDGIEIETVETEHLGNWRTDAWMLERRWPEEWRLEDDDQADDAGDLGDVNVEMKKFIMKIYGDPVESPQPPPPDAGGKVSE
jgi:hypothetical protein